RALRHLPLQGEAQRIVPRHRAGADEHRVARSSGRADQPLAPAGQPAGRKGRARQAVPRGLVRDRDLCGADDAEGGAQASAEAGSAGQGRREGEVMRRPSVIALAAVLLFASGGARVAHAQITPPNINGPIGAAKAAAAKTNAQTRETEKAGKDPAAG